MKGFFGDAFDFDQDGKLDGFEQAADCAAFIRMMEVDNNKTELELSGLNPIELEFMDVEERRKVLVEAGLNPDVYDF